MSRECHCFLLYLSEDALLNTNSSNGNNFHELLWRWIKYANIYNNKKKWWPWQNLVGWCYYDACSAFHLNPNDLLYFIWINFLSFSSIKIVRQLRLRIEMRVRVYIPPAFLFSCTQFLRRINVILVFVFISFITINLSATRANYYLLFW